MAETAFSKHFNKEVDPEQYAQMLGSDTDIHSATRQDIICPVCKVGGASYVSQAVGKKARMAHFRFTSDTGSSPHHPSCDFYDDKLSADLKDQLHDYSKDRTALSALVRKRVCAGIQEGLFSQVDMWNMRAWFFNLRVNNSVVLQINETDFKWLQYIARFHQKNVMYSGNYTFHPVQTTMPGFKWKNAVATEFIKRHRETINFVSGGGVFQVLSESKGYPFSVVDSRVLDAYYYATVEVMQVISKLDPEFSRALKSASKGSLEGKFRAFAALTLFKTNWNVTEAIELYSQLLKVQHVQDMLAGNIIGLDFAHNYWLSVGVTKLNENKVPYQAITAHEIEQEMRNECLAYAQKNEIPLLPDPIFPDEPVL